MKRLGTEIIDFVGQLEDFQKSLFQKRKFITETQFCITVGNIVDEFYPCIAAQDLQWAEWKELFHIDEEHADLFANGKNKTERRVAFLEGHPTLVLDTRHFDTDFLDRLLASFTDIDEITDGLLVNSENFQAINLLLEKYRETIACIYVDPPTTQALTTFFIRTGTKHRAGHACYLIVPMSLGRSWRKTRCSSCRLATKKNREAGLSWIGFLGA